MAQDMVVDTNVSGDIKIFYKGEAISVIDDTCIKLLKTGGTYCEGDIEIRYIDPEKPTQEKSAVPSETEQMILPDYGKVLSKVTVGAIPADYIKPSGTKSITENGSHDVTQFASVEVAVINGVYNRRYEVTNPSNISGTGNYLIAVSGDKVLQQVRDKESLIVIYHTDGTTSCVKSAMAANKTNYLPTYYTGKNQTVLRINNDGTFTNNFSSYGINDDTSITAGSGRVYITADGDLRIYGNTNSYAIPAGKIIIDVFWGDN